MTETSDTSKEQTSENQLNQPNQLIAFDPNNSMQASSRSSPSHLLDINEIKTHQKNDNLCGPKYQEIKDVVVIKKKNLHKTVIPFLLRLKLLNQAHEQFGHPDQNNYYEPVDEARELALQRTIDNHIKDKIRYDARCIKKKFNPGYFVAYEEF
ncbi:transposon Ty3-G Gag-Pol polyprotein [Trichonephila clavipes]|uniref:Transposon Ty3-G Gag-Pol polyprotein n=1 Tax=Trichonephila clavipes TaxID=2585209 RepID=A0A8X6RBY1_TRICX|nr:transposon Ty3-G Gag-Pol polyprotein [Trichonephila clavipes]